jgi:hypothetical protein
VCVAKQWGPLSEIRPSMLKRVCQEGPRNKKKTAATKFAPNIDGRISLNEVVSLLLCARLNL